MQKSSTVPNVPLPQTAPLSRTSYRDALVSSGSVESHFSVSNAQRRMRQHSPYSSASKNSISRVITYSPNTLNKDTRCIKGLPSAASAERSNNSADIDLPDTYRATRRFSGWTLLKYSWKCMILAFCLTCTVILSVDTYAFILHPREIYLPPQTWNSSALEELTIPLRLSRLTNLMPPPTGVELFVLRRNLSCSTMGNYRLDQHDLQNTLCAIPTACLWMHDQDLDGDLGYLHAFITMWQGPISLLVATAHQRSTPAYNELLAALQNFGQRSVLFPETQSKGALGHDKKPSVVAAWLDLHLISLNPLTSIKGFPNAFISLSRFFAPDEFIVLFPSLRHIPPMTALNLLQLSASANLSKHSLLSSSHPESPLESALILSTSGPNIGTADLSAFNSSSSTYLYDPYAPLWLHKTNSLWCPDRFLYVRKNWSTSLNLRLGSPQWKEIEEEERRLHWNLCLFHIFLDSYGSIQRLTTESNLLATNENNDDWYREEYKSFTHKLLASYYSEACIVAKKRVSASGMEKGLPAKGAGKMAFKNKERWIRKVCSNVGRIFLRII